MKKWKNGLVLILALVLGLSLAACGGTDNTATSDSEDISKDVSDAITVVEPGVMYWSLDNDYYERLD